MSKTVSTLPEMVGASPGAILRRCREFHGISLEEASETTKIGISYLKALEDDLIHEFANQAYLKGFLRIYATYLGLNSGDVARMYEKLFGAQGGKPSPALASSTLPDRTPRLISIKKLIFPAILLVMILFTATFFKRLPPPLDRHPQQTVVAVQPPPNTTVQVALSSVRVMKVEPDIPAPKAERVTVKPVEPEIKVTPELPADAAKVFILKIRVTQSGTLTTTVDGAGAQQYELVVGDVFVWKAEKNITLDLSNAGGVDVELNGNPYKSLGPIGEPIYVELDADGIKQ